MSPYPSRMTGQHMETKMNLLNNPLVTVRIELNWIRLITLQMLTKTRTMSAVSNGANPNPTGTLKHIQGYQKIITFSHFWPNSRRWTKSVNGQEQELAQIVGLGKVQCVHNVQRCWYRRNSQTELPRINLGSQNLHQSKVHPRLISLSRRWILHFKFAFW